MLFASQSCPRIRRCGDVYIAANLPHSLLTNLDSIALVVISRAIAGQRVACGVRLPGLLHRFFAAIASISSLQFIAW